MAKCRMGKVGLVAAFLVGAPMVTGSVAAPTAASASQLAPATCISGTPVVSAPPSVGRLHGIVRPRVVSASCSTAPGAGLAQSFASPLSVASLPSTVDYGGGSPPLLPGSRSTMGTANTPGAITVTPVYWIPSGTDPSLLSAQYRNLVNNFGVNLSLDSGKPTNSFAVLGQYAGVTNQNGASQTPRLLRYRIHAGSPIIDSSAFPADGCNVDPGSIYADNSGYSRCLTDTQLSDELRAVVRGAALPVDSAHLYALFTPEGLEVCSDGFNSMCTPSNTPNASGLCAYHSNFQGSSTPNTLIYSVDPYPVWDSATGYACNGSDQFPLGNPAADVSISSYAHEIAEAITDPYGTAWIDTTGSEIGDLCAFNYGSLLSTAAGAAVSQRINGTGYYIQGEFSNATFGLDPNRGCLSSWSLPVAHISSPPTLRIGKLSTLVSHSLSASSPIVSQVWSIDGRKLSFSAAWTRWFWTPGMRAVTLTVTDAAGYKSSVTRLINVTN